MSKEENTITVPSFSEEKDFECLHGKNTLLVKCSECEDYNEFELYDWGKYILPDIETLF